RLRRRVTRPVAPTSASIPAPAPDADVSPAALGAVDAPLAAALVGLVAFGVVMVYSASAVFADHTFHDGQHYFVRQAAYAVAGLGLMAAAARFDYHRLRRLTYPILLAVVALMGVVALGFGHRAGGATRWIALGPIHVQPSELAKLALVLWLAYSLSKKSERMHTFSIGFLPHVIVAGLLMLLCLLQPDFGSAIMIGLLTFVLLFAGGAKIGYLLGAVLCALPAGYALIARSPYRMRRIVAFLDPFEHLRGAGYQVAESLMSYGAGGVTGVGLGDSRQKLFFLPEAHTDFIGAIVGEELGFVGTVCLVLVFAFVVYRGVRVAMRAADDYGAYLATGATVFVGLQAFTNLAVAMGMVPTKGLVLPFISYGGSSLLVNCAAVGVLLSVSRGRDALEHVAPEERARPSQALDARGGRGRASRALERHAADAIATTGGTP
ncbi:MAG: putative lipid II flippase FtsW, partial [Myxococcales bacterium]|nr:putative lipid II flippase FtsW [Myxococcales bacterium]